MAARSCGVYGFLTVVLLVLWTHDSVHGIQEYSISPFCSSTYNIDLTFDTSVIVSLHWVNYMISMNCRVQITAAKSNRIVVTAQSFDVHCSDSLNLYDGKSTSDVLLGSYCGSGNVFQSTTTIDNELLLLFKSDNFNDGQGFKLVITSFHTAYCDDNYNFQCDNGHCINRDLHCNGYDNCGDNSDVCQVNEEEEWWIWLVIGIVVAFLVICVIIAVICCCVCKGTRKGTVLRTNAAVTVQYNAGNQAAGTGVPAGSAGVNPWYTAQTNQPQAYPASYPPPNPYSAPPPAYSSISGPTSSPEEIDPVLRAEKGL